MAKTKNESLKKRFSQHHYEIVCHLTYQYNQLTKEGLDFLGIK